MTEMPLAAILTRLPSMMATSASLTLICVRLPCQPYETEWTIGTCKGRDKSVNRSRKCSEKGSGEVKKAVKKRQWKE